MSPIFGGNIRNFIFVLKKRLITVTYCVYLAITLVPVNYFFDFIELARVTKLHIIWTTARLECFLKCLYNNIDITTMKYNKNPKRLFRKRNYIKCKTDISHISNVCLSYVSLILN